MGVHGPTVSHDIAPADHFLIGDSDELRIAMTQISSNELRTCL